MTLPEYTHRKFGGGKRNVSDISLIWQPVKTKQKMIIIYQIYQYIKATERVALFSFKKINTLKTSCSSHCYWGFKKCSTWANNIWEPRHHVSNHTSVWSLGDSPLPQEHSSPQQYRVVTYGHRNVSFTPSQEMSTWSVTASGACFPSLFSQLIPECLYQVSHKPCHTLPQLTFLPIPGSRQITCRSWSVTVIQVTSNQQWA